MPGSSGGAAAAAVPLAECCTCSMQQCGIVEHTKIEGGWAIGSYMARSSRPGVQLYKTPVQTAVIVNRN